VGPHGVLAHITRAVISLVARPGGDQLENLELAAGDAQGVELFLVEDKVADVTAGIQQLIKDGKLGRLVAIATSELGGRARMGRTYRWGSS
jgi:hypothetical protein